MASSVEIGRASVILRSASPVWLATHRDPDGDAIGSLLGLGAVLREMGTSVTLSCQDGPSAELAFLPGLAAVAPTPPTGEEVLVALDAGDLGRLGDVVTEERWRSAAQTIVIDHHASNVGFGKVNLIEPSAASTAEILIDLVDEMGVKLPDAAVTCLLTGIVTDTLGFRTSNTSAASLRKAARLVDAGASLPLITEAIFSSRPLPTMRLLGRAVEHLEVRGRLGVAWIGPDDFAFAKADATQTRGIVNFLAEAQPIDAVAFLRDDGSGSVDVSMRSRPGTNVIPAAQMLGGGGHPQAAGARLETSLEEARRSVWDALASLSRPGPES